MLIAQALKNASCDLRVVVRREQPATILAGWVTEAVYPEEIMGHLADIDVEVTYSPEGFELAHSLTTASGILMLKSTLSVDVSVNLSKILVDEFTLVGSRCGNYPAGLRALASGLTQVGDMVDSIYSLDQGLEAVECAGEPGVLKMLIRP